MISLKTDDVGFSVSLPEGEYELSGEVKTLSGAEGRLQYNIDLITPAGGKFKGIEYSVDVGIKKSLRLAFKLDTAFAGALVFRQDRGDDVGIRFTLARTR